MNKIYISGPMTGVPDNNFPAFQHAADRLRAAGYTVISPHEIETPEKTRESYLRADLKAMLDCQIVATLTGWEQSEGACLEVHVAREVGITVVNLKVALSERESVSAT